MGLRHVVIVCAIFLFFTAIVNAELIEKKIMRGGESIVIGGKNITFIGSANTKINFIVDGVRGGVELELNESRAVNGAWINVLEFSKSPLTIIANLEVRLVCGDGTCSEEEGHVICCRDCGCLSDLTCSNNICIENITEGFSDYECHVDADCATADACQIPRCDLARVPTKCVYTALTACVSGDNCCPQACETPTDADCATIDKCKAHTDCDDGNACTDDLCDGDPKRCAYTAHDGCTLKGKCWAVGTMTQGNFCTLLGEWKVQQSGGNACDEDYECITGICSLGTCGEEKTSKLFSRIFLYGGVGLLIVVMVLYVVLAMKRKG